jgi:hypothetical protein
LFNANSAIFQLYHGENKLIFQGNIFHNRIGGVMVSVLASSAVDCGFEPQSFQTKDFKIGIFCNLAKHTALGERAKKTG